MRNATRASNASARATARRTASSIQGHSGTSTAMGLSRKEIKNAFGSFSAEKRGKMVVAALVVVVFVLVLVDDGEMDDNGNGNDNDSDSDNDMLPSPPGNSPPSKIQRSRFRAAASKRLAIDPPRFLDPGRKGWGIRPKASATAADRSVATTSALLATCKLLAPVLVLFLLLSLRLSTSLLAQRRVPKGCFHYGLDLEDAGHMTRAFDPRRFRSGMVDSAVIGFKLPFDLSV
mmetsp:Transcript_34762/g.62553  ORF Transcript_34762/g.62553 Transcript_34762/m.62553 type:complete len:232 (+) Transcript_34762:1611-2306(+)